ncbi:hypothetical protein SJI45_17555 [Streptomyces sp. S399]|uniref:hypothetical protein n=1 Tax=Streptomyces sp. S399 TaxID=3096009 RepID=UPI002A7F062F|nr:hypothetical protein [Streptomyces sp. S399]WPR52570.1 hypothetical protein SJI45_17555 [Streptomyces sp. S399]
MAEATVAARATLRRGDWGEGVTEVFDLIFSNPPYIGTQEHLPAEVRDHEPGAALFAGSDGFDDYRRIAPQLPGLLAPGGAAILEIGATQASAVTALLEAQGFAVALRHDLGGHGVARGASARERCHEDAIGRMDRTELDRVEEAGHCGQVLLL